MILALNKLVAPFVVIVWAFFQKSLRKHFTRIFFSFMINA